MDDQISSTTDDQKNLQQADEKLASDEFTDCKNFDDDDILDLAGGARDAIERHRSEDKTTDIKNVKIHSRPGKEEAHAEAKDTLSQCK